jgi:Family of unknown function (DUF5681)
VTSSRWVKGQSGNRRGRPRRGAAVAEYLRHELKRITGEDNKSTRAEELARVLIDLAIGGDVAAAKLIIDRVDGAVAQPLQLTGVGGGPLVIKWQTQDDEPYDAGVV